MSIVQVPFASLVVSVTNKNYLWVRPSKGIYNNFNKTELAEIKKKLPRLQISLLTTYAEMCI